MDKQDLERAISEGFSTRKLALLFNKSQTTIRYHLDKYNLKTSPVDHVSDTKICPKCNEEKPLSDYTIRKGRGRPYSYCKSCSLDITNERRRDIKRKAIEYKGGRCEHCGLEDIPAVFEFHHLDPLEKEISISKMGGRKWASVKIELDKCVLLCANCHRKVHSEI